MRAAATTPAPSAPRSLARTPNHARTRKTSHCSHVGSLFLPHHSSACFRHEARRPTVGHPPARIGLLASRPDHLPLSNLADERRTERPRIVLNSS
ncbi:hypothetical protein AAHC03_020887 [Spirometra sp. Aus1]